LQLNVGINNHIAGLQRALEQRDAEIEKLKQEKARWVGMVAHDLRHPVSAVLAYAELLLESGSSLTEEDRALVSAIRSSTEFMLQLINDVFDIASLDSVPFSLELVDPELLVRSSVDVVRPLAQRKKIRISVSSDAGLPAVMADMQRMLQAFTNIIGNAVKYCPGGSSIDISIAPGETGIQVCVKDNGPGIPADEIDTVFQPFQKTRSRAASSEPGTGLGLAICKGIVERHDGRIWVDSTAGEGCTFFVTLPAAAMRSASPA
jgi:signal transduction histidine kinase